MGEQTITEKIVLAYSGGLDTSVLIKYLQEKYNAEVITVTVDVGQGKKISKQPRKKPKNSAFSNISQSTQKTSLLKTTFSQP